jgi:hypothetical protein
VFMAMCMRLRQVTKDVFGPTWVAAQFTGSSPQCLSKVLVLQSFNILLFVYVGVGCVHLSYAFIVCVLIMIVLC